MPVIIDDIVELTELFTEVALSSPLTALLMAFGTIFVAFSLGVFGYLTLGAVVDAIIPDSIGRAPPPEAR